MLAENYLYFLDADCDGDGCKICLMHKCGTMFRFRERRTVNYNYEQTKGLIRFMESMTDECCDQFLDCCGQATEAKKRAKLQAKLEAIAALEAEKAAELITKPGPPVRTKEELAQIKLEKEQRALEKAARRAEKLKQREVTAGDTPHDHDHSA